jgi:hypothetical protein
MPTDQKIDPMPHAVPDADPYPTPVRVKTPRKPRGPNKPKVKPVDKPVDIPLQDVNEAPKNTVVRAAALSFPELEAQVLAARTQPKVEYVPPTPTPRQAEKIKQEMEAGAKRTAYFQEQERLRAQIKPDVNEATTTPVFRPKDFVPKHGSRDPGITSPTLK